MGKIDKNKQDILNTCPNCGSEKIEYLEDNYLESQLREEQKMAGMRRGIAGYLMDTTLRFVNLFTKKRRYLKCMACGYQWKSK